MLRIKIAFIALTIFSLTACEKNVTTIEGPKAEPKLVLACFISPQDTIIKVNVSKSLPVFGAKQNQVPQPISNATVIITEGANSSGPLPYDMILDFYYISTAAFPIVEGKTYSLKVTVPEGLSASAACTVPGLGNGSTTLTVDSSRYLADWGDSVLEYRVKLEWTDKAGQKNYYRSFAEIEQLTGPDSSGNYSSYLYPFYLENIYNDNYSGQLDDKDRDGQKFTLNGISQSTISGNMYSRPVRIIVGLMHTDDNYYLYHMSVFNSNNNGGNPFAEPVLIYSNVTNGLGVFAAYNTEYREVDL